MQIIINYIIYYNYICMIKLNIYGLILQKPEVLLQKHFPENNQSVITA